MRISRSIALLTESQQLDDRIRSIIKQLKLPVRGDAAAASADPIAAMAADEPDEGGEPGEASSRSLRRAKTKEEWMKVIADMAVADPTGDQSTYLQWIVRQVLSGNLVFPEDIDKTKEALERYDKMRRSPKFKGDKNIMTYKLFSDLSKTVRDNMQNIRSVMVAEGAEVVAGPAEVHDVVFDQESKKKVDRGVLGIGRIIKVMTAEAANKLFQHTDWCVKDPRWFNSSSYAPPFYMIELKKAPDGTDFKPMFLHDRKSYSLKNAADHDATLDDMRPYGPLLMQTGILDEEKGLRYVLSSGRDVKESQPLAYLAVLMSKNRELKMKARDHLRSMMSRITGARN